VPVAKEGYMEVGASEEEKELSMQGQGERTFSKRDIMYKAVGA